MRKVAAGVDTVYVYSTARTPTGDPARGPCYLFGDHLGSTRSMAGVDGTMITRTEYLPFGEESTGISGRLAGNPYVPTVRVGPEPVRQMFTGKERDAETGLAIFNTRYFSNAQGRFTSPYAMIAKKEWLTDPQRWNYYAYVRNNPLRYIDPNGEDLEIYFYYGKDLTDAQREYLQANMKQIQASIADKFMKAGVEKVNFRDGMKLTDKQVAAIQKNAPAGVATLNFVNQAFARKAIGGNGATDAPMTFRLGEVLVTNLVTRLDSNPTRISIGH